MREAGGFKDIIEAVEKLGKRHQKHINAYGEVCMYECACIYEISDNRTTQAFDYILPMLGIDPPRGGVVVATVTAACMYVRARLN